MPLENVQNPHGYDIFGTSRTKVENPHGYGILQNAQKDETRAYSHFSRHVRSGDCTADLPTALFALKVLTGTRFQISRRRCIPPYAGSNGAESDGGKDRHRKWACAMCLAFNVRQDGRSLALDPLDPARRAGNEFERKHDQGRRPLAYRRAGIRRKGASEPKGGKGEERPANEWEGGSKGAKPPWPA